jgi:hypothetical protein
MFPAEEYGQSGYGLLTNVAARSVPGPMPVSQRGDAKSQNEDLPLKALDRYAAAANDCRS